MPPGYDGRLYFLAFDHRAAFARSVFDDDQALTAERERSLVAAKEVIFAGVEEATLGGVRTEDAGILVDELYGATVARDAREAGVRLAMPVEEPDQECFAFAYGSAYGEHIQAFDPDFAKVLVRYNVEGDRDVNLLQADRLAELSQWLQGRSTSFLFELLVEPTARQLEAFGGDRRHYELARRPELICAAMAELQAAGVEPDVWKVEGLDEASDAARVAAQARAGEGRREVACVVLGAGAAAERVEHWLDVAATVEGFAGFAIGRSIWRDPVRDWLSGKIDKADASRRIAGSYIDFVRLFETATVEQLGT